MSSSIIFFSSYIVLINSGSYPHLHTKLCNEFLLIYTRQDLLHMPYLLFYINTDGFVKIKKEKPDSQKYNRSTLIYDSKHSFYPYLNIKSFSTFSPTSKYSILLLFFNDLNKFNSLNPQSIKERKVSVYDNTPELYNEYLEIYFGQYMALLDARKRKLENKYNPINLFLDTYS